jgi:upstream activation factor subunit UAF30
MATKPAAKKPAASKAAPKKEGAVKSAPAKVKAPKDPAAKPNALQKPLQPSPQLAEVVGSDMLPRGEVVSKVWEYIREKDLQNPKDKREILADDKLKAVFGKDKVTMFEMNKYLAQHLK